MTSQGLWFVLLLKRKEQRDFVELGSFPTLDKARTMALIWMDMSSRKGHPCRAIKSWPISTAWNCELFNIRIAVDPRIAVNAGALTQEQMHILHSQPSQALKGHIRG